jgi:hypothetical protein
MTGYQSKKAAAQAKTIDEVNWVDHEPNGLAQPAQEPVAWLCKADKNGMFGLPTADKACKDCFPVYAAPPRPAHEPVAWMSKDEHEVYTSKQVDGYFQHDHIPLYTTPPQRPWVELEGEEIRYLWEEATKQDRSTMTMVTSFAKDIETKLKEKNNAA